MVYCGTTVAFDTYGDSGESALDLGRPAQMQARQMR